MNVEVDTTKTEAKAPSKEPVKLTNPATVKKAVVLGKEIRKQPEKTKADAARAMFELISGEPREIIIQAFVDGAGLTPKGAQTYFYNCRRKANKPTE